MLKKFKIKSFFRKIELKSFKFCYKKVNWHFFPETFDLQCNRIFLSKFFLPSMSISNIYLFSRKLYCCAIEFFTWMSNCLQYFPSLSLMYTIYSTDWIVVMSNVNILSSCLAWVIGSIIMNISIYPTWLYNKYICKLLYYICLTIEWMRGKRE